MNSTSSPDPAELFSVAGNSVVVTGGTRGIGLAIAEGFVKAGARVFICSRSAASVKEALAHLRTLGDAAGYAADLSAASGREEFTAFLSAQTDGIDILVNNAGTIWVETLADYPESGWDKVYDLNVKATFFIIQALTPLLQVKASAEAPARIINIGSIDAFHVPKHDTFAYSSSKAAIHQVSKHLALRLAPDHVTVNVIAPGMFESKMLKGSLEEKGADHMLEPVPLKRFATPGDIAGAAIFLASPAGSYVTGAVLPVDGGHGTTT